MVEVFFIVDLYEEFFSVVVGSEIIENSFSLFILERILVLEFE